MSSYETAGALTLQIRWKSLPDTLQRLPANMREPFLAPQWLCPSQSSAAQMTNLYTMPHLSYCMQARHRFPMTVEVHFKDSCTLTAIKTTGFLPILSVMTPQK